MLMLLSSTIGFSQELSKKVQKKKDAFEAKLAAEEKYLELLSTAEFAFEHGRYAEARDNYEKAIEFNPDKEPWLISKINDLDILMAETVAQLIDTVSPLQQTPEVILSNEMDEPDSKKLVESYETHEVETENIDTVEAVLITEPKEVLMAKAESKVDTNEVRKTETNYVYPKAKTQDELIKEKEQIDYSKYPVGVTEEFIDLKNHTIQRIVVVDSNDVNVYKRVRHNWGGDFTFKNDLSISKRIWLNEVEEAKHLYGEK